jgi:hypothetical protein
VLNVASTHTGHFATKTEGKTVETEFLGIKHKKKGTEKKKKKKDYVNQKSPLSWITRTVS